MISSPPGQRRTKKLLLWTVVAVPISFVAAYIGVQQTTAFELARERILSSPEAAELGMPVTARLRPFGYAMRVSDSSGTAEFALNLRGAHGSAVAHAKLTKELGRWEVVGMSINKAD